MEELTEDTDARGPVRPYALLGGEPRPDRRLDPGTLLTLSTAPPDVSLRPFHAQLLSHCGKEEALSVTEIAHSAGTTLQLAGMGLADLVRDGYVVSPTPEKYAEAPDIDKELLHRVLDGLRTAL